MAEAFSNSLSRAIGIVTTITGGNIGVTSTKVTGISTAGIGVSDMIVNANFIAGTKVTEIGIGTVTVDRSSTNTAASTNQSLDFLGLVTALTASDKTVLIGGTFANNTDSSINLTVEVWDQSSSVGAQLASKIPVPSGSSFVISDAGKTVLETSDEIRVYADSSNAVDVSLSVLTGVS